MLNHRFIPNSTEEIKNKMLNEIGIKSVDEIYEEIPKELRFNGKLNLPQEPKSEAEVSDLITDMLGKNKNPDEYICFLGAGCYDHYQPALVSEVMGRSEFLTAYTGTEVVDHGKFQAIFEYQSMIGDLVDMDVVGAAVYDGFTAAGDAILMASKITERKEILLPEVMDPDKLSVVKNYIGNWFNITFVKMDKKTGTLDTKDLASKLSSDIAAVYIENPNYFGVVETKVKEISKMVHENGAILIAGFNPISLGVLAPPGEFGADIACGEGQPLGHPMALGGTRLGILACKNEPKFVDALPMLMVGILRTPVHGERAYTSHPMSRKIFYSTREEARSFSGTSSFLLAIGSAVYMALLGPEGIREIGMSNIQKAYYAMRRISQIDGIKIPYLGSPHFNEFLVDFSETGKNVSEVNKALLKRGILGGKDLSKQFPEMGQVALYCVTEKRKQSEIDLLVEALKEIVT
ncbi:MAG: aminomethyl-transferring glycine dehydrogenase subunit GcvPA [Candidatus Micrarchaeaceae archaeon]